MRSSRAPSRTACLLRWSSSTASATGSVAAALKDTAAVQVLAAADLAPVLAGPVLAWALALALAGFLARPPVLDRVLAALGRALVGLRRGPALVGPEPCLLRALAAQQGLPLLAGGEALPPQQGRR